MAAAADRPKNASPALSYDFEAPLTLTAEVLSVPEPVVRGQERHICVSYSQFQCEIFKSVDKDSAKESQPWGLPYSIQLGMDEYATSFLPLKRVENNVFLKTELDYR